VGVGTIVSHITYADEASIGFYGQGQLRRGFGGPLGIIVMGDLDRVTGTLFATTMTSATTSTYELHCKPTKSLF
jgi:hypothetical protein